MARPTDRGTGLARLRDELGACSVLYVGDDVPDEGGFAVADVRVKVGTGDNVTTHGLDSPTDVSSVSWEH